MGLERKGALKQALTLQLHFLQAFRSHLRIIRREMDGVCGDRDDVGVVGFVVV